MDWPALLDTPRRRLRPPSLGDAPAITAYASDPEVIRYVAWRRHRSEAEPYTFLHQVLRALEERRALHWAITQRATGVVLGMIGLRLDGHRAELGCVVARPHWGQGIATEATRAVVDWAVSERSPRVTS